MNLSTFKFSFLSLPQYDGTGPTALLGQQSAHQDPQTWDQFKQAAYSRVAPTSFGKMALQTVGMGLAGDVFSIVGYGMAKSCGMATPVASMLAVVADEIGSGAITSWRSQQKSLAINIGEGLATRFLVQAAMGVLPKLAPWYIKYPAMVVGMSLSSMAVRSLSDELFHTGDNPWKKYINSPYGFLLELMDTSMTVGIGGVRTNGISVGKVKIPGFNLEAPGRKWVDENVPTDLHLRAMNFAATNPQFMSTLAEMAPVAYYGIPHLFASKVGAKVASALTVFFPFRVNFQSQGEIFTKAVDEYVALPKPKPEDATKLAGHLVDCIAAGQGHAAFDVLNNRLENRHLDLSADSPLWNEMVGVIRRSHARFGNIREIGHAIGPLLQVQETPHYPPTLRAQGLRVIGAILQDNWDNLNYAPVELKIRAVNALVTGTRSADSMLYQVAATSLRDSPELFLIAARNHFRNPIPGRVMATVYNDLKANLSTKLAGPIYHDEVRNHVLSLIEILRGNVLLAKAALEGRPSPHIDLKQLWDQQQFLVTNYYGPIMLQRRLSEILPADTLRLGRSMLEESRTQSGAIASRLAGVSDPQIPAIADGQFREASDEIRGAYARALMVSFLRKLTGENSDAIKPIHVDRLVLDDLSTVIHPSTRGDLTPLDLSHIDLFRYFLGEAAPLAVLGLVGDERSSLNIYSRPRVFCHLVENYPAELVGLAQWLRRLSIFELGALPISRDARGLLNLLDESLTIYQTMVGELPEVLTADRREGRASFDVSKLGVSERTVEYFRRQMSVSTPFQQTEIIGAVIGIGIAAGENLRNEILRDTCRAQMRVVELFAESLCGLYRPQSGWEVHPQFRAVEPAIQLHSFTNIADLMDSYAHGLASTNPPYMPDAGKLIEVAHFQGLAAKYRELFGITPPPQTGGNDTGPTGSWGGGKMPGAGQGGFDARSVRPADAFTPSHVSAGFVPPGFRPVKVDISDGLECAPFDRAGFGRVVDGLCRERAIDKGNAAGFSRSVATAILEGNFGEALQMLNERLSAGSVGPVLQLLGDGHHASDDVLTAVYRINNREQQIALAYQVLDVVDSPIMHPQIKLLAMQVGREVIGNQLRNEDESSPLIVRTVESLGRVASDSFFPLRWEVAAYLAYGAIDSAKPSVLCRAALADDAGAVRFFSALDLMGRSEDAIFETLRASPAYLQIAGRQMEIAQAQVNRALNGEKTFFTPSASVAICQNLNLSYHQYLNQLLIAKIKGVRDHGPSRAQLVRLSDPTPFQQQEYTEIFSRIGFSADEVAMLWSIYKRNAEIEARIEPIVDDLMAETVPVIPQLEPGSYSRMTAEDKLLLSRAVRATVGAAIETDRHGMLGGTEVGMDTLDVVAEKLTSNVDLPRHLRDHLQLLQQWAQEPFPLLLADPFHARDAREALNIFMEPRVFRQLVESHPDAFVRVRATCRALASIPFVESLSEPLSIMVEHARSVLVATDMGLNLYRGIMGDEILSQTILDDLSNPQMTAVPNRFESSARLIDHGATLIELGSRQQEFNNYYWGYLLPELGRFAVSILPRNSVQARAWMRVTSVHLESAIGFVNRFNQIPHDQKVPELYPLMHHRVGVLKEMIPFLSQFASGLAINRLERVEDEQAYLIDLGCRIDALQINDPPSNSDVRYGRIPHAMGWWRGGAGEA